MGAPWFDARDIWFAMQTKLIRTTNHVKLPSMVTAKSAERPASPREGLIDALVQASFVTMAVLSRIGSENDLSLTQLRVLGILRDRRLRMSALADYLGLERSTISGLIDRAATKGMVARAPSAEDGRAMDVFLTKDGARLVERLRSELERELAPLLHRLESGEQRMLERLLRQMLDGQDD
ncbi:Transcriptional regulator, MarR family protein [Minicystis rosea]|nr:Transcriptional regulator, MarR family protein [Minicystis rosea]